MTKLTRKSGLYAAIRCSKSAATQQKSWFPAQKRARRLSWRALNEHQKQAKAAGQQRRHAAARSFDQNDIGRFDNVFQNLGSHICILDNEDPAGR
jgi:hypothetical protein